jgi:hypothetical protein
MMDVCHAPRSVIWPITQRAIFCTILRLKRAG